MTLRLTAFLMFLAISVFGQGSPRTYDTVAQMAAQNPNTIATSGKVTVEVRGYSMAGDSGGGTFFWNSTATNSADDGIYFAAQVSGLWERTDKTQLTVKMFGAKGDGVQNDTAYIQRALSSLSNGIVNIPSGTYLISPDVLIAEGSINADSEAVFRVSGTNGTAIRLGSSTLQSTGRVWNLPQIQFANSTNQSVGVDVLSAMSSEIYVPQVQGASVGIRMSPATNGIVFSDIAFGNLTNCVTNIVINPTSSGVVTRNNLIGDGAFTALQGTNTFASFIAQIGTNKVSWGYYTTNVWTTTNNIYSLGRIGLNVVPTIYPFESTLTASTNLYHTYIRNPRDATLESRVVGHLIGNGDGLWAVRSLSLGSGSDLLSAGRLAMLAVSSTTNNRGLTLQANNTTNQNITISAGTAAQTALFDQYGLLISSIYTNHSPSASLQVDSTNRGFLPPRMTQAQRSNIVSPATGLVIYNTTSNNWNGYNGTAWTNWPSGGGGGTGGSSVYANGTLYPNINFVDDQNDGLFDLFFDGTLTNFYYAMDWSTATNKFVAGANMTISKVGSTLVFASTGGGGSGPTNGTAVYVDAVGPATSLNLADNGDIGVSQSGTNVTWTILPNSVALGTDTTGNYVQDAAGVANHITVSGSGSESASITIDLANVLDIGGITSFEIPNGAAPSTGGFGQIAADNDAWAASRGAIQTTDGTANTYLVGVLASDTPSNGQVPTWNTGGTITWETPTGGAGGGSGTNLFLNNVLLQPAKLTNSSSLTGGFVWLTNASGDFYGYATNLPAGGGGGSGTNAFVNNVLMQPFKLTNNAAITGGVVWLTNAGGDVYAYATNITAGGGGGSGTNIFVGASTLVQPAHLTDSANVTWSVSSSTNIQATFTGVGSNTNGYILRSGTILTNLSNSAETFVWDFNLPASTLSVDGDELEFFTSGRFLNNSGGAGGYTWRFYADGGVSPILSGSLDSFFPDISSDKAVLWRMRLRRLSNTSAFLIVDHLIGDQNGSTTTNDFGAQLRKTTPPFSVTGFDGVENFQFTVDNSASSANLGHTLYGYTVTKVGSVGGSQTRTGIARTIPIAANWFSPESTEPATASTNTWATATDRYQQETWDFSATSTNGVRGDFVYPMTWNAGTLNVKIYWKQVTAEANTTNVWSVALGSASDGDTGGALLGTRVEVLDQGLNDTNKVAITSWSTAITPGNSGAAGDYGTISLRRLPGHSSDNMTVVSRLLRVLLEYTESATEPTDN